VGSIVSQNASENTRAVARPSKGAMPQFALITKPHVEVPLAAVWDTI
jgi:hypothetical protein